MKTYSTILTEFKEQHKNDGQKKPQDRCAEASTTLEIGNTLENLVDFIFKSLPVFNVARKVRTNTNEIDHIIKLTPEGRSLELPFIHQCYIIGESKNYDSTIGVTWANKVYSLLSSTSTKLALIFSFHGLTGSTNCGGWQEAKGFTKKILLSSIGLSCNEEDKAIYILDFNYKHFEKLGQGISILEIIEDEIIAMKMDVKNELVFSLKHDSEEEIVNTIAVLKKEISADA